jgi:hypothetical protein
LLLLIQKELKISFITLKKEGINRIKRVSFISIKARGGSLLLLLLNKLKVGLLLRIVIIIKLRY